MTRLTLPLFKKWLKSHKFSNEPLKLNEGETIIDREKFVKSHIKAIEARTTKRGKVRALCYWHRLERYYFLVNGDVGFEE